MGLSGLPAGRSPCARSLPGRGAAKAGAYSSTEKCTAPGFYCKGTEKIFKNFSEGNAPLPSVSRPEAAAAPGRAGGGFQEDLPRQYPRCAAAGPSAHQRDDPLPGRGEGSGPAAAGWLSGEFGGRGGKTCLRSRCRQTISSGRVLQGPPGTGAWDRAPLRRLEVPPEGRGCPGRK